MSVGDLLVVAGEASGDLHGGRLLAELKALVPELRPFGLGGDEMGRTGFEALAHSSEISVVGFTEVLRILRRALRIFRMLLAETDRRRAAWAVLIDFPDFNLRLAAKLRRRGVRVIYYISPQVWAWRRRRVTQIARTVDRMLVLFPFEVDFYRRHGVEAVHVGHPLIDEIPTLVNVWDRSGVPGPVVLSLLPGSRSSEVRSLLPPMLASVRLLAATLPVKVQLIQAPTVPAELFDRLLAGAGVELVRVREDRFRAIAQSHLALCASGTATIEVGLLGTPMIVLYRLTWWSYSLARLLVRLPHFSMVNLVLGEAVVPELLQGEVEPRRLCAEAVRLLGDPEKIAAMRRSLAGLRQRLGSGGASRRAAAEIAARLAEEVPA